MRSKLDPKAIKHIFVGYEDGLCAIRYYDATTRQVSISRNYKFVEDTRGTNTEVDLDEVVDAIKRDLGDNDGDGDGDGDGEEGGNKEETRTSGKGDATVGTMVKGGNTLDQTLTDENPINPPVENIRVPATTSTSTTQHQHPQCTWNFVDYRKLNNPATRKTSDCIHKWAENHSGIDILEPEIQQEIANFAAEIFAG